MKNIYFEIIILGGNVYLKILCICVDWKIMVLLEFLVCLGKLMCVLF